MAVVKRYREEVHVSPKLADAAFKFAEAARECGALNLVSLDIWDGEIKSLSMDVAEGDWARMEPMGSKWARTEFEEVPDGD